MIDSDDGSPIRVFTFPDRADALLIYVREGQELWLPRLRSPFQRYELAMRLGEVDINATVRDSSRRRRAGRTRTARVARARDRRRRW